MTNIIYPRCQEKNKTAPPPYISSEGYLFPCCWMANHPYLKDILHYLGPDIESLNINKYTFEEIKNSFAFKKIEDSWKDGSLKPCAKFCSKPIKNHNDLRRDSSFKLKLS